ncbi:MAG: DndE family protein [Cellvibrionaceae bacterium]|nr:DndE family protein [Cellvibrionaceae bacterium]
MLPARNLKIPKETESHLERLELRTRVTPNVSSRIAFFTSVESGYRYDGGYIALDSKRNLDKVTWLGELSNAVDATLTLLYPELNGDGIKRAWADHVRDGVTRMRAAESIQELI